MPIGLIWQTVLETPLINFLVALSALAFGSYGLAILVFTVIIRAVTFPLTLRTLHASRALQSLNPKIQDIQKRYSDPKRRTEETMKLYKEAGVNPLGCLGGQLLQIPVFIALYATIRITLGGTPESLLTLEDRLYNYAFLRNALPLSEHFLGIDLSATRNLILAVLTAAAMWLQQRISTSSNPGQTDQQRQQNQMMLVMMPGMFGYITYLAPAGVALYWIATTVIGIVLQWIFVGPGDFTWGTLIPAPVRDQLGLGAPSRRSTPQIASPGGATGVASAADADGTSETRSADGSGGGNQRSGRRRRRGQGAAATRPQPGTGGRGGSPGG
ncbi:MAG: YidC/Oxa1 family membrane protein insertase [Dehalococcoidia bacterium]